MEAYVKEWILTGCNNYIIELPKIHCLGILALNGNILHICVQTHILEFLHFQNLKLKLLR